MARSIMVSGVTYAVALAALLCVIAPAHVRACPNFSCTGAGCSTPIVGALTQDGPGQFATLLVNQDQSPVTEYADCCKACQLYNSTCSYWTFTLLEDGTGVCFLYNPQICASGNDFVLGAGPLPGFEGASFLTGSLCASPGVVGDPHYTGADNSHFDFTGVPDKVYCMLSDAHLHINVFHGGRFDQWGDNPHKPLTWIRRVAVFWGHHVIQLAAREGATWQYGSGYMQEIVVDGERVALARPGEEATFAGGAIAVRWAAARERSGDDETDVYEVAVRGALRMRVRARPEIALLRTPEDGLVHFGLELSEVAVSPRVHGVLGQTFRKDHENRLALQKLQYSEELRVNLVPGENAEGFLDGRAEDYEASSLLATDCRFSRFARAETVDPETAQAIEMSHSNANAGLHRKFGGGLTAAA